MSKILNKLLQKCINLLFFKLLYHILFQIYVFAKFEKNYLLTD